MRRLRRTARFRQDDRRVRRRGKDISKLDEIVDKLLAGEPLDPERNVHRLVGNWYPCWECHIESNWLLVWEDHGDMIVLRATGTHSDIFG